MSSSPATAKKARPPSNPAPDDPRPQPKALDPAVVELVLRLRKELTGAGHDAGPDTIAWHLQHDHGHRVSRSTISRYLTGAGLITPEPKKKPKSSYIRFAAAMPNQTWQSDFKCRRRHLKSYADLSTPKATLQTPSPTTSA
jgi:hypothetical protein